MTKTKLISRVALLIATICLGACTNTPVRYYLMSPIPGEIPDVAGKDLLLGVGPVQLPDYVNRPNLVTRASATRIEVPKDHKWGATLDSHFTAILAENLRDRLGLNSVLVYPWQPGTRLDYQLSADITRFIYTEGAVRLDAGWSLRKRNDGTIVDGASRISETSGDSYDDIVDAMSRAVARLADEIIMRLGQARQ